MEKKPLSGLKATLDLEEDLLKTIVSDYFQQRGYPVSTKNIRFGYETKYDSEGYKDYQKSYAWVKVDLEL